MIFPLFIASHACKSAVPVLESLWQYDWIYTSVVQCIESFHLCYYTPLYDVFYDPDPPHLKSELLRCFRVSPQFVILRNKDHNMVNSFQFQLNDVNKLARPS